MKMKEMAAVGLVAASACLPRNIVIPPTERHSKDAIGMYRCGDASSVPGWSTLSEDERVVVVAVRAESAIVLLCCGMQWYPVNQIATAYSLPPQDDFIGEASEVDGAICVTISPFEGKCENVACISPGQQRQHVHEEVLRMLERSEAESFDDN